MHIHTHMLIHTHVGMRKCLHVAVPFRMLDAEGGIGAAALNAYRLVASSMAVTLAALSRVLGLSTISELR